MRRSILGKLGLALGIILAMQLAAGLIIDANTRSVRRTFQHLVAFEEQASAAANEMEIASEAIALNILGYLDSGDPHYREQVAVELGEFEHALREYVRLTRHLPESAVNQEIEVLHDEFATLGEALMEARAEQNRQWDQLSRQYREAADRTAPPGEDPADTAALLSDERNLSRLLLEYMREPQPQLRSEIDETLARLGAQLSALAAAAPDGAGRAAIEGMQRRGDAHSPLYQLLDRSDYLAEQVPRFMAVRQHIDDLLDQQVQTLTASSLADAQAATARAVERNRATVLLLVALGLILSGGSAAWLGGRIVRAARALREGARRFGQGDYSFRIPTLTDDELGEAAREFNQMAEQRQRAEEALRDEQMRSQAILRSVPDSVITLDAEGRIVEFNPAAEKTFGLPRREVQGQSFEALFLPEFSRALFPHGLIQNLLLEDGLELGRREEWTLRRGDGREFPAEVAFTRVPVSGPALFTGCLRDLTEQKREEKQKRELQERLARADRMAATGQLAEVVADELNNILGPVVGYPEMIARNLPKHSSLLPQLNDIERAGTEAATLVQDLQLIGGGGGDPPAPVNLNTVITECLNDPLRSARTRRHPEIRMRLQLAADLPAIQGSPRSLGRVAASLIDHALDAVVGKGLILVSTALEHIDRAAGWYESGPPGQYVTLRIKFSGPPLTDVELERIFEPSPTRPRRGLAMTLVYQVARQHGGFIQVHAEPAEGNEFVMYFAPASQPAPIEPEPARHLGGSETVMVVDDREELRRLAALQLQQQGYQVVTAENGEKAIALIAAERRGEHPVVDILVLDFLLGDGPDGVETFRRILEIKPHQKAIMVSGFAETERMMEGRRLGIGRFVQKPYSAATLGQAVRAELDRVAEAVSSV